QPRRTLGTFRGWSSVTASNELGPAPEPSHPRRSPDTEPKGAETRPGTVAFPLAPLQCRSPIYTMCGAEIPHSWQTKRKGTCRANRCTKAQAKANHARQTPGLSFVRLSPTSKPSAASKIITTHARSGNTDHKLEAYSRKRWVRRCGKSTLQVRE